MELAGIEIRCPHCRGDLRRDRSELVCVSCGRRFPVVLGIPDLRVFPDPYIDLEADRDKGRKVAAHFDGLSFEQLVDYYYSITSVVPPHHARQYKRGLMAGEARAEAALDAWEDAVGTDGGMRLGPFLDVGCGTAPLLIAASKRYDRLVGVDIAFRWLVVAKKRLTEAGLEVPLICACAEALPFPEKAFDRVAFDSVIETVRDQRGALAECERVLRPGGRVYLATPNRFSLGPDPHTGIWAGGYLPDFWVAARVRRQGGIPPKRRLLSARALSRLVVQAGLGSPRIWLPDVSGEQREQYGTKMRLLIDGYHFAKRLPVSRGVLRQIGPLFYATSTKPG